ncbi:MAG TPA: YbaK/EbsC family protein [bacterium]|nr:YbaK/EbsC family protein [bacterium]
MPVRKLKEFLDEEGIKYVSIKHSLAYTAQEVAVSAHVQGKELAKTVIVRLDGKLAMAVLPATRKIDIELLKKASGTKEAAIPDENEFKDAFPECDIGAMPPFGNLYGMAVYVDDSLSEDEEIAFNAGTHTELIKLAYMDFTRLVKPVVAIFSTSA